MVARNVVRRRGADCLILTFGAIATASKLFWTSLDCDVIGTLDRVDRVTQFIRFDVTAHLIVPSGEDAARARQALEKAERNCLISTSLTIEQRTAARIVFGLQGVFTSKPHAVSFIEVVPSEAACLYR